MTLVSFVNQFLSLGVVISQIGIIALIVYLLFFRSEKFTITEFIGKHGLLFAFLASLTATLGSLFYSQIAGFPPCDLCWFQRIFMYPEVFLLGMALIKKDSRIVGYGLLLAIVGGVVSLYHNYIYYYDEGLNAFCQLGTASVSCVKRYVFEFGYVTIPLMALTVFALVILFLIFYKRYTKSIMNQ